MAKKKRKENHSAFYYSFDGFLFHWMNNIRKNNISIIKWFFKIFLFLALVYLGLYYQSKFYPQSWSLPLWAPEVAIPTILTITGIFFTIIVLFTIVPKGTQTGDQFMYLLIREIDSLKNEDEITIISPNINIGTTTYKTLLDSLIKSIQSAKTKGAKVSFITYSLSKAYLDKFTKDDSIATYSNYYLKGEDTANDSKMLTFLGKSYDKHESAKKEYEKTIDDLKLLLDNLTIVAPKTTILDQGIVGFLSNSKLYIGKYYPDSSNDKQITVKGEVIDTPATVLMLKEHFIKDL